MLTEAKKTYPEVRVLEQLKKENPHIANEAFASVAAREKLSDDMNIISATLT